MTAMDVKTRFWLLLLAKNSVDLNSSNVQHDTSNEEKSVEEQRNCSEYLSVQLLHGVSCVVDVNDSLGGADNSRILEELSSNEIKTFLAISSARRKLKNTATTRFRHHVYRGTEIRGWNQVSIQISRTQCCVYSQLNLQVDQSSTAYSPWIECLSRGGLRQRGLRQPSVVWFHAVQELEREFGKRNELDELDKQPVVIKRLTADVLNLVSAPEQAVACFIKTWTFIRMRHINRQANSIRKFVAKNEESHAVSCY